LSLILSILCFGRGFLTVKADFLTPTQISSINAWQLLMDASEESDDKLLIDAHVYWNEMQRPSHPYFTDTSIVMRHVGSPYHITNTPPVVGDGKIVFAWVTNSYGETQSWTDGNYQYSSSMIGCPRIYYVQSTTSVTHYVYKLPSSGISYAMASNCTIQVYVIQRKEGATNGIYGLANNHGIAPDSTRKVFFTPLYIGDADYCPGELRGLFGLQQESSGGDVTIDLSGVENGLTELGQSISELNNTVQSLQTDLQGIMELQQEQIEAIGQVSQNVQNIEKALDSPIWNINNNLSPMAIASCQASNIFLDYTYTNGQKFYQKATEYYDSIPDKAQISSTSIVYNRDLGSGSTIRIAVEPHEIFDFIYATNGNQWNEEYNYSGNSWTSGSIAGCPEILYNKNAFDCHVYRPYYDNNNNASGNNYLYSNLVVVEIVNNLDIARNAQISNHFGTFWIDNNADGKNDIWFTPLYFGDREHLPDDVYQVAFGGSYAGDWVQIMRGETKTRLDTIIDKLDDSYDPSQLNVVDDELGRDLQVIQTEYDGYKNTYGNDNKSTLLGIEKPVIDALQEVQPNPRIPITIFGETSYIDLETPFSEPPMDLFLDLTRTILAATTLWTCAKTLYREFFPG